MRTAATRYSAAMEGLSAETLALMLAVGLVLGTFPVFGCPTILCAAAALALRLNLPALQLVNQFSSPLQVVLLVPLTRAGARIIGAPAGSNLVFKLGGAALQAAAGWCCICVPLGIALYFTLLYSLRRSAGNGRPHGSLTSAKSRGGLAFLTLPGPAKHSARQKAGAAGRNVRENGFQ